MTPTKPCATPGCSGALPPDCGRARRFCDACVAERRLVGIAATVANRKVRADARAAVATKVCACGDEFHRWRGERTGNWQRRERCPDCAHERRVKGLRRWWGEGRGAQA